MFESNCGSDHGQYDDGGNKHTDGIEDWAERDTENSTNEIDFINVAEDELHDLQPNLANSAFIHGLSVCEPQYKITEVIDLSIPDTKVALQVVTIDTCANNKSIVSIDQYWQYFRRFGLQQAIIPSCRRNIKGIGGTRK